MKLKSSKDFSLVVSSVKVGGLVKTAALTFTLLVLLLVVE